MTQSGPESTKKSLLVGESETRGATPATHYSPEFLETNKDYYLSIEDYDWVDATDQVRGLEAFFHKLRAREVRQLVAKHAIKERMLDAGCGTALNLRDLPAGSIGVDINPRNLPRARRYAPRATVLQGDLEGLPFPDETFSTVLCTEVLEHFPEPGFPLNELKRVLRSGGRFIGSVPADSWIWHLRFLSSTCPHGEPYHKNYERREIEALLQGLRVLSIHKGCFGMSWFFVAEKP